MKLRTYTIIARVVEEGVRQGYYAAHKYTETPSQGTLEEAITSAVISEISSVIDFEDES